MRGRTALVGVAVAATVGAVAFVPGAARAAVPLLQVSSDPYTDVQSQHQTQVEPDTFQWGNTIVAAFQSGRAVPAATGGASNIDWATSKDGGATWTKGKLPFTTGNTGGPWQKATDPVVGFSAKHNAWLISFMGITGPNGTPVLTSRSTNGGLAWSKPIVTAIAVGTRADKNWLACDNRTNSPFHGTCYTSYTEVSNGTRLKVTRSTDGGLTWSPGKAPADNATGYSAGIVIRPGGTVVVAYLTPTKGAIRVFRSVDGGGAWQASTLLSTIQHHVHAGGLRDWPLPSVEGDGAGRIYAAWSDCRFRPTCPTNDIVISESADGQTWEAPYRVPLEGVTGSQDHMVPGLGVDPATAGATAKIGLTYYFYRNTVCTLATCLLSAGFTSSVNGGTSWAEPLHVAGPMAVNRLPDTSQGRMFGDYISTTVSNGKAHTVLPVAKVPAGEAQFDVAMYYPVGGLAVTGGNIPSG